MTLFIIVITALISIQAFYKHDIYAKLVFNPYIIKRDGKQWFRFISSGFIHADWMHLGVNMFVFFSFGSALENYYTFAFGELAKLHFIILYLSSIAIASLSTFIKYKDSSYYNSLGASGAVSAITFACILFSPRSDILLYGFPIPSYVYGALYLIYSSYMGKRGGDHINHDAHFYGAIYGIIYTLVFKPGLGLHFLNQFGLHT